MTFVDVFEWCKKNQADVRAIGRGLAIPISHKDKQLPADLPAMSAIMHWDLKIGPWSHYTSGSDMERIVTGTMTVDEFKGTLQRAE